MKKIKLSTLIFVTCGLVNYPAISLPLANAGEAEIVTKQGIYEVYNKQALKVLNLNAPIKTLSTGHQWLEGPLWIKKGGYLLFSDIPANKVYRYQPQQGVSVYLEPSGQSNGLLLNQQNKLVLLQSGSRQVATMNASLAKPKPQYNSIVSRYAGKKFNSPNDGAFTQQGTLYFTDPAYGLKKQLEDPAKELAFQGLYSLTRDNSLNLLDDELIYPNGVALSVDQKTLYLAASNPSNPAWYRYQLNADGSVKNKTLFYKLPPIKDSSRGLPDGLKVHPSGIIFATGPDGLLLFNEQGVLLAKVFMPSISANLAFNADHSKVYITAHNQLLSLNLKHRAH